MKKLIVYLLFLGLPTSLLAAGVHQLSQLIDYVGVDYAGAVEAGKIINPAEYGEMEEFSVAIREGVVSLPASPSQQDLLQKAGQLSGLVNNRVDPKEVASLTAEMRQILISNYEMKVVPSRTPDLQMAESLYGEQCASCHGVNGAGDGPTAALIEPKPINFLDLERARQRSLFGYYSTITLGLDGTAMQAYHKLTEPQRWGLAFYLGTLATTAEQRSQGQQLWNVDSLDPELKDLSYVTTHSASEIEAAYGQQGVAIAAFLRSNPARLFSDKSGSPLGKSQALLQKSLEHFQAGEQSQAYELAVRAYLEGVELVEGNLNAIDTELRSALESKMTAYRILVRQKASVEEVGALAAEIQVLMSRAKQALSDTLLSGMTAFVSALLILLREGLEALLVIAALAAFLIKTDRRDGLIYLYMGVSGALLLGVVTWVVSSNYIDITGVQRELTEAIAALFAALVLVSMGFWMHSKSNAQQWKQFIESSLNKQLAKKTLWGLAGLSFIAVYREMFELVLFYQALWVQSSQEGQEMIGWGLLLALLMLAVLGWLILRYSTRLPLRQFFAVSGWFMLLLAFIFTGKGIAALQEAGKLSISPVSFPSIELLGIYPNLEALSVQAGLLLLTLFVMLKQKRGNGRSACC